MLAPSTTPSAHGGFCGRKEPGCTAAPLCASRGRQERPPQRPSPEDSPWDASRLQPSCRDRAARVGVVLWAPHAPCPSESFTGLQWRCPAWGSTAPFCSAAPATSHDTSLSHDPGLGLQRGKTRGFPRQPRSPGHRGLCACLPPAQCPPARSTRLIPLNHCRFILRGDLTAVTKYILRGDLTALTTCPARCGALGCLWALCASSLSCRHVSDR